MNTSLVAVAAVLGALALFFTASGLNFQDSAPTELSVFSDGGYGAAYRTRKGMFFGLRDVTVTGRTEAVRACLRWQNGPQERGTPTASLRPFHIEVDLETGSLTSGNGPRDRHVAAILGAPKHPRLHFLSDPMIGRDFVSDIERGQGRITGQLDIGGRQVPVDFDLQFTREDVSGRRDVVVEGRMETTFSTLGVAVPCVGPGGLIAAPTDDLQLFARLLLSSLPGAKGTIGLLPDGDREPSARTL